ncbi:MAG: hypothetical protein P8186_30265 [Anaerolineae bacterium]
MSEERKAKIEPTIEGCSHTGQIQDVTPSAQGCEDCLKIGDTMVLCGRSHDRAVTCVINAKGKRNMHCEGVAWCVLR